MAVHVELDGWDSIADMLDAFRAPKGALDSAAVVIGCYDGGGYDGSATVFFQEIDGNWFEVYASHCSCYGLEDQWDPTAIDPASAGASIPRFSRQNTAEKAFLRFLGRT